jgi:nicotinamidase-related amidase
MNRQKGLMMSERPAVILIDLQNFQKGRSLGPYSAEAVIDNANRLIAAGRQSDALLIYVRSTHMHSGGDALKVVADDRPLVHGERPEGWDLFVNELTPPRPEEDPVTIKRGWDGFYGSSLDLQLRRHGVSRLVLSGISTNFGVEGTARAAVDRGFNVIFAEDAMTSAGEDLHNFAVTRIFPRIGRVMSTSQAASMLLQDRQLAG